MPSQTSTRTARPAGKGERLEARVTRAQKRLIERAASLRGTTVTEFVVQCAQQAATETIRGSETLVLDEAASKVFVDALLRPAAPNSALKAAARRHRARVTR